MAWVLLCSAVVMSVAAIAISVLKFTPPPQPPARVVDHRADATMATGVGESVVRAWVGGDIAQMAIWYPPAADISLPKDAPETTVLHTSALGADLMSDRTWQVTIEVGVLESVAPQPPAEPGGTAQPTVLSAVRFYQVPIRVSSGTVSVLAAPALVAGPGRRNATLASDYPSQLSASTPLGETVTGFATAMLTDTMDLSRYVPAGSALAPVRPAPFTTVKITDLRVDAPDLDATSLPADGTTVHVLAQVEGSSGAGQVTHLTYPLTATTRLGRWEITGLGLPKGGS